MNNIPLGTILSVGEKSEFKVGSVEEMTGESVGERTVGEKTGGEMEKTASNVEKSELKKDDAAPSEY